MIKDPLILYNSRLNFDCSRIGPVRGFVSNHNYWRIRDYEFCLDFYGDDNLHIKIPSFLFISSDISHYYSPRMSFDSLDVKETLETVTIANYNTMTNLQDKNTNIISNNNSIYFSSFKDQFIYKYHKTIFDNKLTALSGSSNNLILKQVFDELLSFSEVKYHSNIDDPTSEVYECFIGEHTHYRMNHLKDSNQYRLNVFFTYDERFKDYFKNISYLKIPPTISWVTGVNNEGGLIIDYIPVECPDFIHDSFYPWLGVKEDGTPLNLDEYIDSFINSNESVLLLYGEKGQGKSTLLKYLLHKSGNNAMITYQDNIADLDILFSSFMSSEDKILIIEDAETFLTKRESGNSSMRRLLNIADGLTSRKDKKVVFTTNLSSLSRIDDALLRDGRCYDAVKFEVFNKEESRAIATILNIDHSLLTKDEYILAELFAISNNKLKRKKLRAGNVVQVERSYTGIGFG